MDPSLEQIERYHAIEEVGRGGMAVVYRGRDRSLDREVAIKVLHTHLADSPESRARFQIEAQAVAKLHHRNIIEIFDYADAGKGSGPAYIVTEFISGKTLKHFMEDLDRFFPEIAILIGIEICRAIGHAHDLGIIHRDLKPENMMIDGAGRLKLMDFGIAKVIDQQEQMTVTGSILGSPAHMAPEMLEGHELDVRSDLFSLGTIIFWLATGQLPFVGKNPHHVLRRILEGDYPHPQQINPEVSSSLGRIIRCCLAQRPEDRYSSAGQLEKALAAEVDDLDLGDTTAALEDFFSGPKAFLDRLKPRVSERLLCRGRERLKAKKHRQALEDLDRLLAMEPGHPEALALVSGIERRKQWARRIGLLAASLVVIMGVAGAAWAAIHFWPDDQGPDGSDRSRLDGGLATIGPLVQSDGSPGTEEARPAATQDGGETEDGGQDGSSLAAGDPQAPDGGAGKADRLRVAVRPPLIRKTDPRLHMPIKGGDGKNPAAAIEHEVVINSQPYFQQLLIDGQLVAKAEKSNYYGQKYRCKLSPGKHRVLLRNPACQDEESTLVVPQEAPGDSELRFGFRMKYKPATLQIDTELGDASVWVDGKFKGTAAQSRTKPITIPIEGKQGTKEVKLRLALGDANLESAVRLKAGKKTVYRAASDSFKKRPRTTSDGGAP